ncbi:hypothetical protein B566_EDAN005188 [Ephemera danica]|nr:hypothetical protein B566_EDAN005188 [Ephemera danica]
MANVAHLVRRQSSRDLQPQQRSLDRLELKEMRGRLEAVKDAARKFCPESAAGPGEDERESWDSKLTFLLATVGYAVGAFLIPYFIMLLIEGMPIFYLELAIGQRLRKGAIGVWSQVSPYLAGIGISSAVVSFNVALYYNTIIAWLKDAARKFCPESAAGPGEDERESWDSKLTFLLATVGYAVGAFLIPYFIMLLIEGMPIFYLELAIGQRLRKGAIGVWSQVSPYLAGIGISSAVVSFNVALYYNTIIAWCLFYFVQIAMALLIAWVLVYLCMIKGIASSGKVVYVTATFPYIVLIIFFFRGWWQLTDPVVWLEAGTQIFFSLGLAFGGLIAFSSYNPVNNNCYRDAILVSLTNCFTSMFAGIVVFSIIGFKFPGAQLWSILFFLMLFTLGIDSQFGTLEGVWQFPAPHHRLLRVYRRLLRLWIAEYLSPLAMISILVASIVQIALEGSGYPAWVSSEGTTERREWPTWSLVLIALLVLASVMWIPGDELAEFHGLARHHVTPAERVLFGFREDGSEGVCCPTGGPADDEEDDDDDT